MVHALLAFRLRALTMTLRIPSVLRALSGDLPEPPLLPVRFLPTSTSELLAAAVRVFTTNLKHLLTFCVGNPESELITYFTLKAGEAQACPCAQQHFKLVKVPVDQISW